MKKYLLYAFSAALCCLLLFPARAVALQYYIASGGESINMLAEEYAADAELLAAINNFDAAAPVSAGTLLLLPEEPALRVTVRDGDTLSSLAGTYGIDIAEICAQNSIKNANRIYPGQTLLLPLDEETAAYPGYGGAETVAMPVFAARGSSWLWPVAGVITSFFGPRSRGDHSGIDLAADQGSVISAAAAGIVIESGWKNDSYGYTVMLDHGDGKQTLYAHCSELLVKTGDSVRKGAGIALIGSTGNSTGPHVHFELRIGGVCVDPLDYLR